MATGAKMFNFEGHNAPVHSVCPHCKENVHVKAILPFDSFIHLLPLLADLLCYLKFCPCCNASVYLFNIGGWKDKSMAV